MAEGEEKQIGGASTGQDAVLRHTSRSRDGSDHSFASSGRGSLEQPWQVILHGFYYRGRRMEPGIEDVRVDDLGATVESIEFGPNRGEESAAVKASGGFVERHVQVPLNFSGKLVQHGLKLLQLRSHSRCSGGE